MSLPAKSALIELLPRLALVAIVTGRTALQARDIVGLEEMIYVGNHGLERLERGHLALMEEARPYVPFLRQLLARLRTRFPSAGLVFEDKGGPFAVRYRLTQNPEKSRDDVLEAIGELAGGRVKVLMGKAVINVLPPVELNKGTAVSSLVKEYGLSGAILIGDDITDIDSFRGARYVSSQEGFASISIAVLGPDSPPELEREADYTLSSVPEVVGFLTWLVKHTG